MVYGSMTHRHGDFMCGTHDIEKRLEEVEIKLERLKLDYAEIETIVKSLDKEFDSFISNSYSYITGEI